MIWNHWVGGIQLQVLLRPRTHREILAEHECMELRWMFGRTFRRCELHKVGQLQS
jgi:hypothetical protein